MSDLLVPDEWMTYYFHEYGLIPAQGKGGLGMPHSRPEEHAGDVKRALPLKFPPGFS